METTQKKPKALHITLWIVQALLSINLLWASGMKLLQSPDKLTAVWPWTADNRGLVTLTGVLDLLAALGLVLPMLLHIKPKLTVYAAICLVLLMIAAGIFHISRGETSVIGFNIVIAILAAFVAWGRGKTL